MKKLIERDENGNFTLMGIPWERLAAGKNITKGMSEKLTGAIYKLKDYEDIEIDPEIYRNVKEFYEEYIKDSKGFDRLIEQAKDGFIQITEPKWIPAEKPPKHSGKYLATINMNGIRMTGEVGFSHGKWINQDVIAWMEKPEPYKESV